MLKKKVEYCFDRSRPDIAYRSGEMLVYFMHGAFNSASQWYGKKYSGTMHDIAESHNFPPFTVVSFNTSAMSFFSDEGDVHSGNQASETWFLKEFMPMMEEQYGLCSRRACRGLIGSSMGGFGSIKTILRHPDLFRFAGANFPAILPVNIYDWTLEEWKDYFSDKSIGSQVGVQFVKELYKIFPTRELYDQHDPVVLVKKWKEASSFPPIYFDVGGQDEFGFYDGFNRLKETLDQKGYPYASHYDPSGDHLWGRGDFGSILLEWTASAVGQAISASKLTK